MFDYRDFDSYFPIICCLIGAIIMCFIFLKIYDRTPPETIEKDIHTPCMKSHPKNLLNITDMLTDWGTV